MRLREATLWRDAPEWYLPPPRLGARRRSSPGTRAAPPPSPLRASSRCGCCCRPSSSACHASSAARCRCTTCTRAVSLGQGWPIAAAGGAEERGVAVGRSSHERGVTEAGWQVDARRLAPAAPSPPPGGRWLRRRAAGPRSWSDRHQLEQGRAHRPALPRAATLPPRQLASPG
eukprot:scaffold20421_cov65-Phaeocystis_antarctica.AAC.2